MGAFCISLKYLYNRILLSRWIALEPPSVCCSLVTFKVLNSIVLLGKSYDLIEESKQAAAAKSEARLAPLVQATSKDDLELLTMPKVSSLELNGDQMVRRSQSLVELVTEKEAELEAEGPSDSPMFFRSSSFAADSLLCNSTVSLQSVGLHDTEDDQETASSAQNSASFSIARHRETPNKDKKTEAAETQPLSEVDRYTMVCNRII